LGGGCKSAARSIIAAGRGGVRSGQAGRTAFGAGRGWRIAALAGCWTLSAAAADTVELAPVTVTAQKAPQDEREVPLSITVLDGEQVARSRIVNADDISRYAANTRFTKHQLFIRGIGTGNSFGFDPSVAVLADGVYLGRATAALTPLWDLAQVEVIRGPQGTLLGKNTIAGALSLTTAAPQAEPFVLLEGSHGDLDPGGLRAVLNQPLGQDWGLRLAGLAERSGHYIHNTTREREELGRRNEGLRARLGWTPGGAWSGGLGLEYSRIHIDGFGQQLSAATPQTLALYRRYDPQTEADLSDYRASVDAQDSGGDRAGRSATLNLAWEQGPWRLSSLSNLSDSRFGYRLDSDHSPIPLILLGVDEDYAQWSQELRASLRQGDFEYLLGAYALRADLDVDGRIAILPEGVAALATGLSGVPAALGELLDLPPELDPIADESRKRFRQDAASNALFGQATWRFAPRASATAGLRWTRERKRVDMQQSFDNSGLLFRQFLQEEPYEARRRRSEQDLSPKLALQYAWSPGVTLYALGARGFKGGGFNDFAPTAAALEFEEERATSFEAGFKTLLLDRRLALNLNLFDTRIRDLQVISYDGAVFYVRNAAAARARGAELELRARLGGGWQTHASLGYLDARYTDFRDAPARADQPQDSQDLSGEPLPAAARRSGVLGLEYIGALPGRAWSWRAGVDALYRDRSYLSLDNDPVDAQPAYALWNATLSLGPAEGQWLLRLNGQNLGDALVRNTGNDVPLFSGDHWAELDPPRRGSATLEVFW